MLDSVKLAVAFGFEIIEFDKLKAQINGCMTVGLNCKQILINENFSKEWKRYTIAYLLCHYLLFYNNDASLSVKHIDNNEDIWAAYMARLLLIDEELLIKCNYQNLKIEYLSNIFNVPYKIMEKRIDDVDLKKRLKVTELLKKKIEKLGVN